MTNHLNADLTKQVIADTAAMDWQASPSSTVWRKRLYLEGGSESGRVTSVVRYNPSAAFPAHAHPDGEEILVLEGTFSDEFGDYPAGYYLLNPEGFRHSPFSREGCIIFVKLRQYSGSKREQVAINTRELPWQTSNPGITIKPLYNQSGYQERMRLEKWSPGTSCMAADGAEIFILEGSLNDESGCYSPGTWLRYPVDSNFAIHSESGCALYVRTGGFDAS